MGCWGTWLFVYDLFIMIYLFIYDYDIYLKQLYWDFIYKYCIYLAIWWFGHMQTPDTITTVKVIDIFNTAQSFSCVPFVCVHVW